MTELEVLKGLVGAVIEGACGDYVRIDGTSFDRNCRARKRLEDFFRSDRFSLYTGGNIDPEYIIKELQIKRDWNELVRAAVLEKFGTFQKFAEALYPDSHKKREFAGGDAKYWLKSSKYPEDYLEWERVLEISRCMKCGFAFRGKRCPDCGERITE